MTGRPTDFTPELGDEICALLGTGKSLRKICAIEGMPGLTTVMRWLAKGNAGTEPYVAFRGQYADARETQAELYADELIDISDDDDRDYTVKLGEGDEGIKVSISQDNISRAKLRIDTRKWVASKLLPKKYGEKVQIDANVKTGKLAAEDEAILNNYMSGKNAEAIEE